MSNTLKISGPIKVGSLASDPAGSEDGFIYYNTTDSKFKMYQGGTFTVIVDEDIIGTLDATPTNYTPTDAAVVADHLSAIDTALSTAGGTEFLDTEFKVFDNSDNTKKVQFEVGGITTSTTRTIIMADADVNLAEIALNNAKVSADGSVTSHSDVTVAGSGIIISDVERTKLNGIEALATADQNDVEIRIAYENNADRNAYTDAEKTKLGTIEDSATADQTGAEIKAAYELEADTNAFTDTLKTKLDNVEPLADVTDATNVASAGATMDADTDVSANGWVLDEDDMLSDDATKVPTQQSVKAYVDTKVSSAQSYKGGYDAATDTPSLDSAPNTDIAIGDQYTVTVAGTFYAIDVEIGDVLIAEQTDASTEAEWTIVQANLNAASIKVSYESNSDTNAFTDAEQTKLTGIETSATADQTGAEIKSAYEAEADTNAFTDAEKSALATKISNVVEDTTPELGGDLEVGANAIEGASNDVLLAGQNSVKRAKQASKSSFIEEEYIHAVAMIGSQTDTVISDLTFAHATVEGLEISYKVKEDTSNDIKIGTIRCVTNGTNVVLNEMSTETADTGITFSAAVNGANIEISYSSGANGATMRADVKKFLA
jgi:hypothetical protein